MVIYNNLYFKFIYFINHYNKTLYIGPIYYLIIYIQKMGISQSSPLEFACPQAKSFIHKLCHRHKTYLHSKDLKYLLNENTKHTWCRQIMKTWSRHNVDRWRHRENMMQTHKTHIMHFLNCEPATKKSLVHIIYKSISWQGVYSLNLLTCQSKLSIHYNISPSIFAYRRRNYNGLPCYPIMGLTILPHYCYLSPIIISKIVPLYDVPPGIFSTVGLT